MSFSNVNKQSSSTSQPMAVTHDSSIERLEREVEAPTWGEPMTVALLFIWGFAAILLIITIVYAVKYFQNQTDDNKTALINVSIALAVLVVIGALLLVALYVLIVRYRKQADSGTATTAVHKAV
jgi:high-affinity nickel permease